VADAAGAVAEDSDALMNQHVIICGLGNVGYRCFDLLRRLQEPMAVICRGVRSEWIREIEACGGMCLEGDASDARMLERAGVNHARAIIAATDIDLTNISIAMDARASNPRIRIIARLFDQDLAKQLKVPLGIEQTFSASHLAAPVFAAAALGERIIGYFDVGDRSFVMAEASPGEETPSSEFADGLLIRFSGNAPTAVAPETPAPASGEPCLCIRPVASGGPSSAPALPSMRQRQHPTHIGRPLRAFWSNTPPLMRWLLVGLLALIASSVAVFHFRMGLAWINAVYFAVTIVTTVGFGDIHLSGTDPLTKAYGCLLMLCGPALLAVLIGIVGDFLVSTRLSTLLRGRRCEETAHHILIGAGHIICRVADALRGAGEEVVVLVEADDDKSIGLLNPDITCLRGDPRLRDSLERAGAERAKSILALSDNDLTNLGAVLAAKEINPHIRTVARAFDSNLAAKLKNQLGLDHVASISGVSAPTFVAAALLTGVIQGFIWRDHLVIVAEDRPEHADAVDPIGQTVPLILRQRGDVTHLEPSAPNETPAAGERTFRILCTPLKAPE